MRNTISRAAKKREACSKLNSFSQHHFNANSLNYSSFFWLAKHDFSCMKITHTRCVRRRRCCARSSSSVNYAARFRRNRSARQRSARHTRESHFQHSIFLHDRHAIGCCLFVSRESMYFVVNLWDTWIREAWVKFGSARQWLGNANGNKGLIQDYKWLHLKGKLGFTFLRISRLVGRFVLKPFTIRPRCKIDWAST
jgi:hypothetical protein